MAARRLVAVMLVLLFLSSLAAALAPVEQEGQDEEEMAQVEPPPRPDRERGELLRERIAAASDEPQTIEAQVGDQLQLTVTADRVATVELVGLGATEDVGPLSPARFDVLLDREDKFPVRLLETERKVGTIVVSPRARSEPAQADARDRS